MDLNDFRGPKSLVVDLQANDRWRAIDELINHLVDAHKIKPEHKSAITESVKRRETAISTGMGFGIALPHGSSDLITEVVGAIGRSRTGIEFGAMDGKPVSRVMLFVIPQGQAHEHGRTLANFARQLHKIDFGDGR